MDDDATIMYVHAWQSTIATDPLFVDVLAKADVEYEQRLPARFARLHAAVPAPVGATVRDIACRGDAAREIVRHAEELGADLVAVGRHGMGTIERLFVGSVAAGLLRRAKCSVLVSPTPTSADRERLQLQVSGSSESWAPVAWSDMLARFSVRNRGRLTTLEIDDPVLGAYTQETGYPFQGAAYDPHDERVELMFGSERAGRTHLTRSIASAHSVLVQADEHGMDTALTIAHGQAETVVRFTSPASHAD